MFKSFKEIACFALNTKRSMLMTCVAVLCIMCAPQASAELVCGYSFDEVFDSADFGNSRPSVDETGNGHFCLTQNGAQILLDDDRGAVVEMSTYNSRNYMSDTFQDRGGPWLSDALSTEITILMWVKFNNWTDYPSWPIFFWKGSAYLFGKWGTSEQLRWSIQTNAPNESDPNNIIPFTNNFVGTGTDPNDPDWQDLADDKWHHYALVFDSNDGVDGHIAIYVDGVERDRLTTQGNGLYLGNPGNVGSANGAGGVSLGARLDDVGFFDEELTLGPSDGSEKGTINYYRVHGLFPKTSKRLVAYPLNTDLSDASGNGRDGSMFWNDPNNEDPPSFVIDAERGDVLSLDGTGGVILPDASSENNWLQDTLASPDADYTIMMWSKLEGDLVADFNDFSPTLFMKGADYSLNRAGSSRSIGWSVREPNYYDAEGQVADPNAALSVRDFEMTFDDGQWHHIAVTKTGLLGEMYLDGQLVGWDLYPECPGDVPNPAPVEFVRNTANTVIGPDFVGLLDDVAIFDTALDMGLEDGSVPGTINWYRQYGVAPSCDDVLTLGYSQPWDVAGIGGTPDCRVDLYDFAVLGQNWQDTLDMDDLTAIAELWLDCIDPGGPLCDNVF